MSKEIKIQIGDVVRLVSGGPKMTVVQSRFAGVYQVVNCIYIHNGEPKMITELPTNCIEICSNEPNSDRFIPDVEPTKRC